MRIVTRWSSTYNMFDRFYKIREYNDTSDEEHIKCFPTRTDVFDLQKLKTDMENLESVNKCLQKESTNILQVRVLFIHPVSKQE